MPIKPTANEEEHFAQLEFERRKKVAQEREALLAAEERAQLKERHWMHCPKDGSELVETAFQGVSLDICPTCGGMWLDAGELDPLVKADKTGILGNFRKLFGS